MATTFTPGPWWTSDRREVAVNRGGGAYQVMARHRGEGSSYCVASVNHWESPDANAKLISAAPDLLCALEAAEWGGAKQEITYYGRNFIDCCPVCLGSKPRHKPDCEISSALAKARGEQVSA